MPIRRTSSGSSQDTGFYNPEIFSDVGSRLVFPTDPDAAAYIAAVESADGQGLEFPIKVAYNDFVLGCKSDGIWTAIKASCIMAGARTLAGALTPLVGTAPTNYNFVAGDYNRTTGLVGDGSTKYLNSNAPLNISCPFNNAHVSVYISSAATSGAGYIGYDNVPLNNTGEIGLYRSSTDFTGRFQTTNAFTASGRLSTSIFFVGVARSSSSSISFRSNSATDSITYASAGASSSTANLAVFSRDLENNSSRTNGRLAFYSIGESLDLALLNNRVDRVVNDIAFFINTGLSSTAYDMDTLKYVNRGYAAGGSLS